MLLTVANGVSTFFEESEGFVTEPGSPQLCYLIVDIVASSRELVFGVKVMISQSCIDFSIWEEKEIYKNIYAKVLSGVSFSHWLSELIGKRYSTDKEKYRAKQKTTLQNLAELGSDLGRKSSEFSNSIPSRKFRGQK